MNHSYRGVWGHKTFFLFYPQLLHNLNNSVIIVDIIFVSVHIGLYQKVCKL